MTVHAISGDDFLKLLKDSKTESSREVSSLLITNDAYPKHEDITDKVSTIPETVKEEDKEIVLKTLDKFNQVIEYHKQQLGLENLAIKAHNKNSKSHVSAICTYKHLDIEIILADYLIREFDENVLYTAIRSNITFILNVYEKALNKLHPVVLDVFYKRNMYIVYVMTPNNGKGESYIQMSSLDPEGKSITYQLGPKDNDLFTAEIAMVRSLAIYVETKLDASLILKNNFSFNN